MSDPVAFAWPWLSATLASMLVLALGLGTLHWITRPLRALWRRQTGQQQASAPAPPGSGLRRRERTGQGLVESWVGSVLLVAASPPLWMIVVVGAGPMELPALGAALLYVAAGLALWLWVRRRWRLRRGAVAQLEGALVALGCTSSRPDGRLDTPRLAGRPRLEGGRSTTLWQLPLGVTPGRLEKLGPQISSYLGCSCEVRDRHGLAEVELDWASIPPLVRFDDFYAARPPEWGFWLGLGESRRGPLWVDMEECPHLLVGGMTGGGKSVFLNQACTGLALEYSPEELRIAAIDLKGGCELAPLGDWPHAFSPLADS
ncbi:MAG: FtsK/SpoIIIE domain-containing protein, partial [Candidatus Dormibacteria bacterium]